MRPLSGSRRLFRKQSHREAQVLVFLCATCELQRQLLKLGLASVKNLCNSYKIVATLGHVAKF